MTLGISKLNFSGEQKEILFAKHVTALCSLDYALFQHVQQNCSLIQMSLCSLASELCVHSYCFLCSFHRSVHAKYMNLNMWPVFCCTR